MRNAAAAGTLTLSTLTATKSAGHLPRHRSVRNRAGKVWLPIVADAEVSAEQGHSLIAVLFMEHIGHRPRCIGHVPHRKPLPRDRRWVLLAAARTGATRCPRGPAAALCGTETAAGRGVFLDDVLVDLVDVVG